MFQFHPDFDLLTSQDMELRIIEKHPGNDVLLPFYYYDICHAGRPIGKISIRIGNNYHTYYNGHVGYEIDPEFRGHRYSLAALKMVLPVARFHGMNSLYLTCQASNLASQQIIEESGAKYLETAKIPKDYFAWFEDIEDHAIYQLEL